MDKDQATEDRRGERHPTAGRAAAHLGEVQGAGQGRTRAARGRLQHLPRGIEAGGCAERHRQERDLAH